MSTTRVALPAEAMRITPGYGWHIDLDIKFDGARPTDWQLWTIRMHVWGDKTQLSLRPGEGVSFEAVDLGEAGSPVVPVIRMTAAQTEMLREAGALHYIIDVKAPGGEAEDLFGGAMQRLPAPPRDLIA